MNYYSQNNRCQIMKETMLFRNQIWRKLFWGFFFWFIFQENVLVVMMTSSNANAFRVTGALCVDFTGHRWIPDTKVSDEELWCFRWFALISKRSNKQSWGWWFEMPSRPLWRNCNVIVCCCIIIMNHRTSFITRDQLNQCWVHDMDN